MAWKGKHGMITQDAFAELLTLINVFKKNTHLSITFNMYPSIILFAMISICTINVNGMHERAKCNKLFASLRGINCDIYLLQETHARYQNEGKEWDMDWGGPAYFSPGTNRSAGVGLLVNPRSQIKIVSTKSDKMGRIITAKLEHTKLCFPNCKPVCAQRCV